MNMNINYCYNQQGYGKPNNSVELELDQYYLLETRSGDIFAIKVEGLSEKCYYIKLMKDNSFMWIKKYRIVEKWPDSDTKYSIVEKLDPSFFRKQKLERLIESND